MLVPSISSIADPMVITRALHASNRIEDVATPESAPAQFLNHITDARVAIALQDYSGAAAHIAAAEKALVFLREHYREANKKITMESGRVVYNYDTLEKAHYFAVTSQPLEVRQVSKGPAWAKVNTLAVTDAEVAYVTLDLNGTAPEKGLAKARKALEQGYYSDSDRVLAKLTTQVVALDGQQHLPQQVASDNIALAREFLSMNNYAGAQFALKHADATLTQLANDSSANSNEHVEAMRKELQMLQSEVSSENRGLLARIDDRLQEWWEALKRWTD